MPKMTIVFPVLNQLELFSEVLNIAVKNLSFKNSVDILIIDNDSEKEGKKLSECIKVLVDWNNIKKLNNFRIQKNEENTGNYPIFKQALDLCNDSDILVFFHSDFFVYEKSWDTRVMSAFEQDVKLGLIGFIGSNEIDNFGGRGAGTMSNFQGREVKRWKGSLAEAHGRRIDDFRQAAVVDGCSLIFKTQKLKEIGFLPKFPPHHFYDRLMCCQILEKGYNVGVLGIECDHISGQTANQENKWDMQAKKWAIDNLDISNIEDFKNINIDWKENNMNPSKSSIALNWDMVIYQEAERLFLTEYRDKKHLFPIIK